MTEEMWKKIIDELSSLRYKGRISPHFYGEPLLDKRICDLVTYARRQCPSAYILFDTNGDYLDGSLVEKLYSSGVNKLFVTSYDDEIPERLLSLKEKYPVIVFVRSAQDFNKVNRSGKIFDKKKKVNKVCFNPSFQLVINWQGDVLLCCMDYYKEGTFGNVGECSVADIWMSDKFEEIRRALRNADRESIPICKYCDHEGAIPW